MTTKIARKCRKQRSLSQHIQTTFGHIDAPRAGRKSLLALGTACLLITGVASADWRVYDSRVETVLNDILDAIGTSPEDVNKNLDDLREQQKIAGETYDPGKESTGANGETVDSSSSPRAEAPDMATKEDMVLKRCAFASESQMDACNRIVELEQGRYAYLQAMRTISEKREAELNAIYEERQGIDEYEQGKLQSNTNRLLALLTHQRIDELNLKMAMETFDSRIAERKEELSYQARAAMDPSKRVDGSLLEDFLGGAGQAVAFKQALNIAKQRDR